MSIFYRIIGFFSIFLMLCKAQAEIPTLPGPAMPEQVGRALTAQQPTNQTQVLPPVIEEKKPKAPLNEKAAKIKFKLNGIKLKGNTVFSTKELLPLYKDKLHKTITISQLFEIAQDITNYYRNNGYIISRAIIPPQKVKKGVVTIEIVEGFISHVSVAGHPHCAKAQVLAFGKKIAAKKPLELSNMTKYLLLANETPGTQVKAVLSPSKKISGSADLILETENHPATGYFSYNNYGTLYIGPQQITASIDFNSLLLSGDSIALTLSKTPKGQELNFADLNYSAAVDDEGTRLILGNSRVYTHPLFVLRPAQIAGLNENYYLSLQFPLIRELAKTLTLQTSFYYLDTWVTTLFNLPLYTDHIRSLELALLYNFADSWHGVNSITPLISQGLPFMGYSNNTNPNTAQTSHPGGSGNFTRVTLALSRLQSLFGPLSLQLVANGQWARDPLLAAEEFTFGGPILGRGYDPAELLGDKGAAGSAELRWDTQFNTLNFQAVEFYAFYDAGVIWNIINLPSAPQKVSGASTGFGTRFNFTKFISGNLMWTQALTKPIAAEAFIGDGKRPRVFFNLTFSWD